MHDGVDVAAHQAGDHLRGTERHMAHVHALVVEEADRVVSGTRPVGDTIHHVRREVVGRIAALLGSRASEQSGGRPERPEALQEQLAQAGTRDATTKLLAIARGEPNPVVRRKAVAVLGRSDDPRVREALQGVVERP